MNFNSRWMHRGCFEDVSWSPGRPRPGCSATNLCFDFPADEGVRRSITFLSREPFNLHVVRLQQLSDRKIDASDGELISHFGLQ